MMNKPICVRSSVHVKPTRDFNHQQQELAEQKRFERLMEQFKADLIAAYTKNRWEKKKPFKLSVSKSTQYSNDMLNKG